jgi:hypothetical protein
MSGLRLILPAALCLSLLLPVHASATQWVNGGINTNVVGNLVPDGGNGVIAAGDYTKRYDSSGILQWADFSGFAGTPVASTDGAGGAVIGVDQGTNGVFVKRVTSTGALAFSPVLVRNTALGELPAICSGGAGASIIAWTQNSISNRDIAAQKTNGSGSIQWTANGLALCLLSGNQFDVRVAPDGAGGAIFVWSDQRPGAVGAQDLYAQRVSSAGTVLWAANGIPVCNASGIQEKAFILADGAGGAFITWTDLRNGGWRDIYAQRIDGSGAAQWAANGVQVVGEIGDQLRPTMAPDGAGGVVVTWEDGRPTSDIDIYAQRLNGAGAVQWAVDGVPVCAEAAAQHEPRVVNDAIGGFIVAWSDRRRGGAFDVFVQRLDGSGARSWNPSGEFVDNGSASTQYLELLADGLGGAYVNRAFLPHYLHRVLPDGTIAWTENYRITWTGIVDEPADQGGFVQLRVDRAPFDGGAPTPPGMPPPSVIDYMVWRRIPSGLAPEAVASTAAARDVVASSVGRPMRLGPSMALAAGFPPGSWEALGSYVAMQLPSYIFGALTHDDSTEAGPADDVFVITSHVPRWDGSISTPAFYVVSKPDSGHSVDNIPPGMPQNLAGGTTGMGVYLAWSPRGERDFGRYAVYRGTSPGFVPSPGNRIGTPTSPGFTDPDFDPGVTHYKVSALDIHGNESTFALLTPGEVGNVRPGPIPAVSFLGRPTPNPARLEVAFDLGLARDGKVELAVFDSRGALVRRIVDREMEAGVERVRWDGRDGAGHSVAPGVYWVKLAAPDLRKSERLVWLE